MQSTHDLLEKEKKVQLPKLSYLEAALQSPDKVPIIETKPNNLRFFFRSQHNYNVIRPSLPSHIAASLDAGYRFFQKGNFKRALGIFNRLNDENPNQSEINIALGRCYHEMKEDIKANKLFNKAWQIAKLNKNEDEIVFANMTLAIHYKKLLDFDNCKKILSLNPNQNCFMVRMCWIEYYNDCSIHMPNSEEQSKEALRRLGELKKFKNTKKQLFLMDLEYFQIMLTSKQMIAADDLKVFLNMIKTDPFKINLTRKITHLNLVLMNLGKKSYNESEKHDLLSELENIILVLTRQYPHSYLLSFFHSMILMRTSPFEAEKWLALIEEKFPDEWNTYLNHSFLLTNTLHEHGKAIKLITETLEKEKNFKNGRCPIRRNNWVSFMYYWLAKAYYELVEINNAASAITEALNYSGNLKKSTLATYYSLLAKCQIDPNKKSMLYQVANSLSIDRFNKNHPIPEEILPSVQMIESLEEFTLQNSILTENADFDLGWGRWSEFEDDSEIEKEIQIETEKSTEVIQQIVAHSAQNENLDSDIMDWEKNYDEQELLAQAPLGLQPAISNDSHDIEFTKKFINKQFFKLQATVNKKNDSMEDFENQSYKRKLV